jgi:hypothetical protein
MNCSEEEFLLKQCFLEFDEDPVLAACKYQDIYTTRKDHDRLSDFIILNSAYLRLKYNESL